MRQVPSTEPRAHDYPMMLSRRLRLALLGLPLVVLIAVVSVAGTPSGAEVSHRIDAVGAVAPVAYVALYVGWTVLMFPGTVMTLAAGALFGFALGTVVALVGAEAGAVAAYLVARRVGRPGAGTRTSERSARIERWLNGNGFVALLTARLMPAVPFNVLNYAAAMAGVPRRAYVTATAIGIVPGTLAYVALGSSLTHRSSSTLIISLYAFRAVTIVAIWVRRGRNVTRHADPASGNLVAGGGAAGLRPVVVPSDPRCRQTTIPQSRPVARRGTLALSGPDR